jgi:ABC-type transporter MlaC component
MRVKQGMVLAVIAAVALAFFAVHAQTQAAESSGYQAIADKFFALLEQGKSEEAIDYAFSTNVALKNLPGKSEQLKAQFGEIERQLGSYHSHTRLAETKVANMFVYQHYFVAYDQQPISLRLKFYKARDTWRVYAVQFDTELSSLIEKQTDQNLDRQFK